tara:strand:- start:470 stop:637 length:168 start_codon:yes stop_codon:yes gene_type:complete
MGDFYQNPIFVGCMFVGMGIGMYVDDTGAGTILGMGVGFIFKGLYSKNEDDSTED